ncbi:shikimate dehydrogenase [Candidatus Photodesmus blepharus]|uniref:Shikimate dehydrogenase (NADP(+)) n=1 Tax=Candidatus Photodesmus blepharonis TaxID=1179155 RepID=A0A084CNE0_9GAMM|nr:shikimate dehydrogenase [Candidatus Photodesmus blepharus]KEY91319.1 shikimate dehydrogenase [Candidatus Photodesmus blepharus]
MISPQSWIKRHRETFGEIDIYVIFGNPIKHSKSPLIHTLFALQTKENLIYFPQLVPIGGFFKAVEDFFFQGGKGCNVTSPFKEEAFQFADKLTKRAEVAGSVNTLKIDDGKIIGDNTDGEGLVQDLLQYHIVKGSRILLIGASGTARGLLKPLLDQKPEEIIITNRTFIKAKKLERFFQKYGNLKALKMNEINQIFDVIINATSAGMRGELPNISPAVFISARISYDLIYENSGRTCFNQWAKKNGVRDVYDGLGMLVRQAAESFMFWRGLKPDIEKILRVLRRI